MVLQVNQQVFRSDGTQISSSEVTTAGPLQAEPWTTFQIRLWSQVRSQVWSLVWTLVWSLFSALDSGLMLDMKHTDKHKQQSFVVLFENFGLIVWFLLWDQSGTSFRLRGGDESSVTSQWV